MDKMIKDAALFIKGQVKAGNDKQIKEIAWKFIIGEQIVNDNRLDPEVIAAVEKRLRKYKEKFIKGSPSNIVTSADI